MYILGVNEKCKNKKIIFDIYFCFKDLYMYMKWNYNKCVIF